MSVLLLFWLLLLLLPQPVAAAAAAAGDVLHLEAVSSFVDVDLGGVFYGSPVVVSTQPWRKLALLVPFLLH